MTDAAKDIYEARHPLNERFMANEAEGVSPAFEQGAFGCNAVALGASHGNSSAEYTTVSGSDYTYFDVATLAFVKFTASAATKVMSVSHSCFVPLKGGKSISTADLAYINEFPEALIQMAKGDTSHTDLSFDINDMQRCWAATEGERGGELIYDLLDIFSSRTNLAKGSEVLGSGADVFTNAGTIPIVATANAITAPDNTMTATLMVPQTGATNSRLDATNSSLGGVTANTQYTASVYFKAQNSGLVGFGLSGWGFNTDQQIDLSVPEWVGVIGSVLDNRTLEDVGGGWYRASITWTVLSDTTGEFDVDFNNTPNSIDGAYVWGFQFEEGELTDYIPTGTTAVTVYEGAVEIDSYQASCRTTYQNEKEGVSNLPFVQDTNGMITANVDANTMAVDEGGKYIDTGLKPNGDAQTITQRISGLLQNFGTERTTDAHTSATATSGTVTTDASVLHAIYKAFDQSLGIMDRFQTSLDTNFSILYTFTDAIVLNTYRFHVPCSDSGDPVPTRIFTVYTVEGSNDNSNWDVLENVTNGDTSELFEWLPLREIASSKAYKYIKIHVTGVNGDNRGAAQEIELNYQELTTTTQRTEKGEHTWDDTAVTESYRIDDVEQSYIPARPDPTETIKWKELPAIGYQDDITLHHDAARVLFESITIAESQALDQAYYEQFYALTDENEDELTDENGDILYILP